MRPRVLPVLLGVVLAVPWLAGCDIFPRPALLAPGTQECVGIPLAKCRALLEDFRRGRPITPTAFSIRCATPPCTEAQGSVDILITWSDGSSDSAGSTWQVIEE